MGAIVAINVGSPDEDAQVAYEISTSTEHTPQPFVLKGPLEEFGLYAP